jgi:hypothetical protein
MKQRLLLPFVSLLSLLIAAGLGQPRSVAAAPPVRQGNQGLQYGAVIDNVGHILLQDEALRLMAQAGAGWVKINFRLGGFKNWTETTTFGYSALSLYDQIIANALNRKLKVLGELSNEAWNGLDTHWQGNNAETVVGGNGDNQYIRDFSQYAAVVLAKHYAGQIDVWEVWNEPSQSATYMYPSNFAQLLAQVYTKTKVAGVTNVRFVSGGITALQDSSGNITADSVGASYLRQVYSQGKVLAGWETIRSQYGSYPLDTVGQHIYLDGFGRTSSANIGTALQLLRNAYVASEGGSTTKKTVITEFGWATNNVSEQVQASNLQTAYTTYKQTAYVERAYWFFTRDEPTPRLYFGLLRANSSQKPAWKSYQTYAT